MFCTHCGKEINELKVEASKPSAVIAGENAESNPEVNYVCPRCGHLIHEDLSQEEVKELARASHAEIQRGNNFFSTGMTLLCIGIIILVISIIFYRLSMKASNNFQLEMSSIEFVVFLITLVVSDAFIDTGWVFFGIGLHRKFKYQRLLKDIQNETFVQ